MVLIVLNILGIGPVWAETTAIPTEDAGAGAAVEKRLTKALTYYYQENFREALPLFQGLSEEIDDLDLYFWTATCAAHEKEYDLAVRHFRKMLAKNPELHRVRLDLADVLIQSGDVDAARLELETVKKTSPPATVLEKIENRLKLLDQPPERFMVAALFTTGLQWDDNISSGPGSIEIDDAITTITIDKNSRKKSGKSRLTGFTLNTCYDPGRPKEFMWNNAIYFYDNHHLDDYPASEFNYRTVDLITGPWWMTGGSLIKFPVGYNDKRYGNERLSNSLHVDPSVEYFLSPRFSLTGAYTFINEKFAPKLYHGSDHQHHRFAFGPTYYIDKQMHLAAGYLNFEKHHADSDYLTYDSIGLTLSYAITFPTGTEAKILGNWAHRRYAEEPPLYTEIRKDQRSLLTLALNQRFLKYGFASLELGSIENRSNAELFQYRKNFLAVNLGMIY